VSVCVRGEVGKTVILASCTYLFPETSSLSDEIPERTCHQKPNLRVI
jgi:hypothetical protein